jgi:anti-sigma B factor antagonist
VTTLHLSRRFDDRAIIVRAVGEVDLVTAPELKCSLRMACTLVSPPKLVVADLSEVEFLGSAGLAVLVELHELGQARRTPLRIVASTPAVLRPLQITGLDQVLDVVDSVTALRLA